MVIGQKEPKLKGMGSLSESFQKAPRMISLQMNVKPEGSLLLGSAQLKSLLFGSPQLKSAALAVKVVIAWPIA